MWYTFSKLMFGMASNLDKIVLKTMTTQKLDILASEFSRQTCIGTRNWIGKRVSKHTVNDNVIYRCILNSTSKTKKRCILNSKITSFSHSLVKLLSIINGVWVCNYSFSSFKILIRGKSKDLQILLLIITIPVSYYYWNYTN